MEAEVVRDPEYGYFRLDPIPTKEELDEYYRKKYFKMVEKGDRAPEIKRQQEGGEEARLELEWMERTLYADILAVLGSGEAKWLLDVGSGTGAFMRYAKRNRWNAVGIEPSSDGVSMSEGLLVYNMGQEEYAKMYGDPFDVVTMLNVLEHVPFPVETLATARKMLMPEGVVCVRVPNDFSVLQKCAEEKLGKGKWWVVSPDHINYFNFESLQKLMEGVGLEVFYKTTDFPMELFLLMGDDYVNNPQLGSECHKKRRNFELSIPDAVRRQMYRSLAEIGVGRSCIIFAKAGV